VPILQTFSSAIASSLRSSLNSSNGCARIENESWPAPRVAQSRSFRSIGVVPSGPILGGCSVVEGRTVASGRAIAGGFAWPKRDLNELTIRYMFLDGWYPRVGIGKKRGRVPGLDHAGGVGADGRRVVLDPRPAEVASGASLARCSAHASRA